ncbi:MAG: hypothetical protein Q8J69_04510 [Sphingobacteriaceae bacterium]|nr:hypothetical protein [Sphingobacteriaceae bacterium]
MTLRYTKILLTFLLASFLLLSACGDEPTSETVETEAIATDSIETLLEVVDIVRDTLTGHWVNNGFISSIQQSKSAFFSQQKMLPIVEVVINEADSSMQIVFGYNEACSGTYTRNIDKLSLKSCDGNTDYQFEFEYDPFKKELLLLADDVNYRFTRLNKTLETAGNAVERQIIGGLLKGTWQSARAERPFGGKLQFDQKGFVRGISSYNKYRFILGYDSYPAFMDVVWLYRSANKHDSYYWQLDGDSLRFHSFRDEAPDLFEEQAVYYRLP